MDGSTNRPAQIVQFVGSASPSSSSISSLSNLTSVCAPDALIFHRQSGCLCLLHLSPNLLESLTNSGNRRRPPPWLCPTRSKAQQMRKALHVWRPHVSLWPLAAGPAFTGLVFGPYSMSISFNQVGTSFILVVLIQSTFFTFIYTTSYFHTSKASQLLLYTSQHASCSASTTVLSLVVWHWCATSTSNAQALPTAKRHAGTQRLASSHFTKAYTQLRHLSWLLQ
jgi:hypothetical protein